MAQWPAFVEVLVKHGLGKIMVIIENARFSVNFLMNVYCLWELTIGTARDSSLSGGGPLADRLGPLCLPWALTLFPSLTVEPACHSAAAVCRCCRNRDPHSNRSRCTEVRLLCLFRCRGARQ